MPVAHQHNDVEVNYCAHDLSYILGGQEVVIPGGKVCLFWGAKPHQLVNFHEESQISWITVPLARFLSWRIPEPASSQLLRGQIVESPTVWEDYELKRRFAQWNRDFEADPPTLRRAASLEIEAFLSRCCAGEAPLSAQHQGDYSDVTRKRAADMAHFIANHFADPISVADIAKVAHVHEHYATALFKKVFGVSIRTYLIQYRVAEAQRMLITSEESVAQIGQAAGFRGLSGFYSNFADACGMPPAQYRRLHRLI